jgi:hypothetical protein
MTTNHPHDFLMSPNLNVNYSVGKPNASVNSRREQRGRASEPSEVLGDSHERNQYPDHD